MSLRKSTGLLWGGVMGLGTGVIDWCPWSRELNYLSIGVAFST